MAETRNSRQKGQRTKSTSLAKELATYESQLSDWLDLHTGEYVLIRGSETIGFFETRDGALSTGYARFGMVSLFVKQVTPEEPIYNVPNSIL
ncbi:MAG TPA: hypothetical protein VGZ22_13320 [Isosphaeraceae bacterium]|nr:hypothetical protein [Isosphaeraceae bacterium]